MSDRDPSMESYRNGQAAFEAGNFEEAARHFGESVQAFPHFKSLELLGESLLKLGRAQEAVVPLAAATSLNRQGRAPALLSKALLALGEDLKARELAQVALDRGPGNRTALEVIEAMQEAYDRWTQ